MGKAKEEVKKNIYEEYFEKELSILQGTCEKKDNLIIKEYIESIKQIIKIFDKQGHSGFSANCYATQLAHTIENALLFKPLSPLTGEDSEWDEVSEITNNHVQYQNKRLGSVFKDGKDSTAYYIDAVVFREKDGSCFTTHAVEDVKSNRNIEFPFIEKTFYIDVVDDGKGNHKIKDRKQLIEVDEYYKLK